MPRRRWRDPDPQIRDRNQLEILGAPGLAGLSRIGAGNQGGGRSNIVIRGGGAGTEIHHVTLQAVAGQTIAAGGAAVAFDVVAGAPTEVRGFPTLIDNISDGAVAAIPVDLTGVANFVLEGTWTTWKGTGALTVTRTRNGATTTRTYELDRHGVATRAFGGSDDGFEVRAGDTLTFTLPNGSGSDQTLASGTLALKVVGVASPTSPPEKSGLQYPATWDYVSGSSPNFAVPNVEVGDMLLVVGGVFRSDEFATPPSGWTEMMRLTSSGQSYQTWWKVATASEVGTMSGWSLPPYTRNYMGIRVPGPTTVVQHNSTIGTSNPLTGIAATSLVLVLASSQFGDLSLGIEGGGDDSTFVRVAQGGGDVKTAFAYLDGIDADVTATVLGDEGQGSTVLELG